MRRAVVTGAAGFLGSHLCERLLAEGWDVLALDSLLTGNADNLAVIHDHKHFRFEDYDITNYLFVPGRVDWILHFASPASPRDYFEHPIHTLKVGALGTLRALGLAKDKGAGFMLASTSEVYGDPQVHPQPEGYWGNVNPVGPRGVYDEAKRYAEAMAMAYHRAHAVPVHIVRIFNSILADETVVLFNDEALHIEPIERYAQRVSLSHQRPRQVLVPSFNPKTFKVELRPASALIKHPAHQEAFELRLRYGRSVKVTGDHSVFVKGPDGRPTSKPVREITQGDYVAIPGRLPVVEIDRSKVNLAHEFQSLSEEPEWLWSWNVRHPDLSSLVAERRTEIHEFLAQSGRFKRTKNFRNTLTCTTRKWILGGSMPLIVLSHLGVNVPEGTEFGPRPGRVWLPNEIELTSDLLWLCGFYLAEGSEHSGNGVHFISMCSNFGFLERAKRILEQSFGVNPGIVPPTTGRGPSLYAHSRALHIIFSRLLDLRKKRIPTWVMQLPLARLKHFLEGFRCGDGTHSGKKVGNELCFETTSEQLAIDLSYLLLRFGIVASYGRYETTFRQKYGDRTFPFYRLTVCELRNFDVLTWDEGVDQTLNAAGIGDLIWSGVREVRPCLITGNVYDFSVTKYENFVAGNGVCCHNTFGPRMRRADGRAVPTFIDQALSGQPLTVHGDGSQTRSLCYVDDLIEGIYRLLVSDETGPVNIGNPHEVTILELAKLICTLANSASDLVFEDRPVDDPEVRCPDISLAKERLGWEPEVTLEEGLKRTMEWAGTAWT